jgi:hypothetical protein
MAGADIGEEFLGPGGGQADGVGIGGEAGAGKGDDADEGQQIEGLVPGRQLGEVSAPMMKTKPVPGWRARRSRTVSRV